MLLYFAGIGKGTIASPIVDTVTAASCAGGQWQQLVLFRRLHMHRLDHTQAHAGQLLHVS